MRYIVNSPLSGIGQHLRNSACFSLKIIFMRSIDITLFFAYLALVLVLGVFFKSKQKTEVDFFLAGRTMRWFPVGISVMVTVFSAMNFIAFPTEIFGHGLYVFLALPIFALVAFPVCYIFMPFFREMRLISVYAYLEKRFDAKVRLLAGVLFIAWRLLWMATAVYAASKLLGVISDMNLYVLIFTIGATACIYTMFGGMHAVMWTDVAQFFVLVGGLSFSLIIVAGQTPGGLADIFQVAAAGGRLKPFYPFDETIFSFDPRIRITLWSCWIGTFVAFLSRYGADQMVMQRYFTARTLRDAKRGFHLNYVSAILSLALLGLLGLAVYADRASGSTQESLRPLGHFARFIKALPYGGCGLLVAGLTAATMSSVDSGIHSCSAIIANDFCQNPKAGEISSNRLLIMALGSIVCFMACFVGQFGSIFEIANRIVNGFGSPLLAMVLMGMFSRSINAGGVFFGSLLGAAWSAGVSMHVDFMALHYYAVVNLLGTICLCYICSWVTALFARDISPSKTSCTWWAYHCRANIFDENL